MQNDGLLNDDDFAKKFVEERKETQQSVSQVPQAQQNNGAKPKSQEVMLKDEVAGAIVQKDIADSILKSFNTLMEQNQLTFPKGYNIGNNLKLMFYEITQKGYLQTCSRVSIANAISECAIQGLSTTKKQGYFINYGGTLQFQRSYFGDIALVKRTGLVKDVYANVIYQGDVIETAFDDYGKEYVKKHESKFENRDNGIIGAYAVAVGDSYKMYAIMSKKELEANWNLSKDSSRKFQKAFPQEASKRTCIRRLIKMIFNTALENGEECEQIIGMYNNMSSDYEEQDVETQYGSESSINAHVDNNIKNGELLDDPFGVEEV